MCTSLWTRVIIIGVEVRPAATFERERERPRKVGHLRKRGIIRIAGRRADPLLDPLSFI